MVSKLRLLSQPDRTAIGEILKYCFYFCEFLMDST
jgi:hypothetical protein